MSTSPEPNNLLLLIYFYLYFILFVCFFFVLNFKSFSFLFNVSMKTVHSFCWLLNVDVDVDYLGTDLSLSSSYSGGGGGERRGFGHWYLGWKRGVIQKRESQILHMDVVRGWHLWFILTWGYQWGIAVVSKQLKISYLVSKQLKQC